MDKFTILAEFNWWQVFLAVVSAIIAGIVFKELFDKFCDKFGIEFTAKRKRREEHELLVKTAESLESSQNILSSFMEDQKKEHEEFRQQLNQYGENRIHDRDVSIDKEKRLNDRIDCMNQSDERRDKAIENISGNLSKLTELFIDKSINDYRWEIINFASSIADKKPVTKDGFKHCFATYEKYEKILDENNLENGEVEISMEIINEAYKDKMLEGF